MHSVVHRISVPGSPQVIINLVNIALMIDVTFSLHSYFEYNYCSKNGRQHATLLIMKLTHIIVLFCRQRRDLFYSCSENLIFCITRIILKSIFEKFLNEFLAAKNTVIFKCVNMHSLLHRFYSSLFGCVLT